jgi:L-iditol 2-dehydrogenase
LQVVKAAGARARSSWAWAGTANRLALARDLGADHVLNVEQDDPAALVAAITEQGLGADVVYECAGAGPAAQLALTLVRRRGRYVQVGLFGRPVAFDLDQVVYRELTVTGSNASTPPSWLRALDLLRSGQVQHRAAHQPRAAGDGVGGGAGGCSRRAKG